jgi:RNA 3'-phosphate cyclase
MIVIDGSYGEGGGQILRTAVGLSALTGKPIRVKNIRAKRAKPGLAAQHLAAVRSVALLCDAEVKGLTKGSSYIEFYPRKLTGTKNLKLEIGTAGSITLMLQASLLACIKKTTPTTLRIVGGTDVKWSPPIDYFRIVFLALLGKLGIKTKLEIIRRGYYPKGGGEVTLKIEPIRTENILLNLSSRKKLKSIEGLVFCSNLPEHIPKRIKHTVLESLVSYKPKIAEEYSHAYSEGTGIVLWATYENTILGASCIGEKGLPAETVAQNAVEELLQEINSGATLDIHAADQLLPYLALLASETGREFTFLARELSKHTETNMWLITHFLDVKFSLEEREGLKKIDVYRSS